MGTVCLLGRCMGGGVVGWSDAVVSTTAVASSRTCRDLVIRASKQRRAVVGAGPVWPGVWYDFQNR